MTLLQVHAAAVCAWIGLVAGETVLELARRDVASQRVIAELHGWIDLLVEGPLIAAILVSGAMLLAQAWPAPAIVLVKVGLALVALSANLVCFVLVRQRIHAPEDAGVREKTRQIRLTGLAIPFGLASLVLAYVYLPVPK